MLPTLHTQSWADGVHKFSRADYQQQPIFMNNPLRNQITGRQIPRIEAPASHGNSKCNWTTRLNFGIVPSQLLAHMVSACISEIVKHQESWQQLATRLNMKKK